MRLLFVCLVAALLQVQDAPGQAMRFTLRPESLVLSNCLAQPGAVPLTLSPTNVNLEVVGWAAAPTDRNEPGEFTLRLTTPMLVGSVVVYGAASVEFQTEDRWQLLDPGREAGRQLQFLALPPATMVEAVRFTVAATPLSQPDGPKRFQATLPFATLVAIRLENVAREAKVTASRPSPNQRPEELVDGMLESPRRQVDGLNAGHGDTNDWVMLGWGSPQTMRGVAVFRADPERAMEAVSAEVFIGSGDPLAGGTNDWRRLVGRATAPGQFRGQEFLAVMLPQPVRALRFKGTNQSGALGLGEIAVLRDLGQEPGPGTRPAVAKSMTVPKAKGAVTIDGRAGDWPAGRTNGFALAWDEERLYVLYEGTGEAARFENTGTNQNELFLTGDAVELMLQTRAGLDAQRIQADRGDVRLLISVFQGRPVAMLYEFHSEDLLLMPLVFRSGNRSVQCDKVFELKEARMELNRQPGSLTLEASVPWKALGVLPSALRETKGDFGRIVGRPFQRLRWADEQPPIPGDIVSGAELHPARWGVLKFGEK